MEPAMTAKILLIDDDLDLLDLMSAAFTRAGFAVLTAQDGAVGAKLFAAHQPDLVVTDIVMPEREGIETIGELKRGRRPPKVIAISGAGVMGGHDFLQWAKALGADAILQKPFQMSALVALAQSTLGPAQDSPTSPRRLILQEPSAGL
jgi:DNA-binding response OmpR family regulator